MECAAIQDVLFAGEALDSADSREHKVELDRIVAMLSRLGGRGYHVKESIKTYGDADNDYFFDTDTDSDTDFESEC